MAYFKFCFIHDEDAITALENSPRTIMNIELQIQKDVEELISEVLFK